MHVVTPFKFNNNNIAKELQQKVAEATGLEIMLNSKSNIYFNLTVPLLNFRVDIGLKENTNEGCLMKGSLELTYFEIITLHCLEEMGCEVLGEDPRLIQTLGWIGKKWEDIAQNYKPFDLEAFDYDAFE